MLAKPLAQKLDMSFGIWAVKLTIKHDNKEFTKTKFSSTTILPTKMSRDRRFLKTKFFVKVFDLYKNGKFGS
jgi:hypothetical protein